LGFEKQDMKKVQRAAKSKEMALTYSADFRCSVRQRGDPQARPAIDFELGAKLGRTTQWTWRRTENTGFGMTANFRIKVEPGRKQRRAEWAVAKLQ
jgi:hypothetical protein